VVHLHERDCSVQRRHQKVVEIAPAPNLADGVRQALFADTLKLARAAGYHNAGTFEFLVAGDERYFIEVNPRLQVEHTVTEQVTGIDLVQAQIRIEQGHRLGDPEVGVPPQAAIAPRGTAIQCRITAEDPQKTSSPTQARSWRTARPAASACGSMAATASPARWSAATTTRCW